MLNASKSDINITIMGLRLHGSVSSSLMTLTLWLVDWLIDCDVGLYIKSNVTLTIRVTTSVRIHLVIQLMAINTTSHVIGQKIVQWLVKHEPPILVSAAKTFLHD